MVHLIAAEEPPSQRPVIVVGPCEPSAGPPRRDGALSILKGGRQRRRGRFQKGNNFSGSELNKRFNCTELQQMSDQELAVQAIREAQHILEEYLQPKHHDHERLLDRLVEVFERPSLVVAVDRLRRGLGNS